MSTTNTNMKDLIEEVTKLLAEATAKLNESVEMPTQILMKTDAPFVMPAGSTFAELSFIVDVNGDLTITNASNYKQFSIEVQSAVYTWTGVGPLQTTVLGNAAYSLNNRKLKVTFNPTGEFFELPMVLA